MDKFLAYLGGIVGGFALIQVSVAGMPWSVLNPVFDITGSLSLIVFSCVFIVRGVRVLLGKS
jgi:hypothetical protein